MGNAPVPSAGCGKATTLTTKEYTISSSGQNRVYYVDSAFQETLAEMHGWIEHALALRAKALEQPHGSDVALCVNGHRNHAGRGFPRRAQLGL